MRRYRSGCCCICLPAREGATGLGIAGLVLGVILLISGILGTAERVWTRKLIWRGEGCYHECVQTLLNNGKLLSIFHTASYTALLPCCALLLAALHLKKHRPRLLYPYMLWLIVDIIMGLADVFFITKMLLAANFTKDSIAWTVLYWLVVSILKTHYVVSLRTLQNEMKAAAAPPRDNSANNIDPEHVPNAGLIVVPGLPGPAAFTQPPWRPSSNMSVTEQFSADLRQLPNSVT